MKARMASSRKLTAVVIELLYEFTSGVVFSSHPTGGHGEALATFRHHSGAVLSRPSLRDVAGAARTPVTTARTAAGTIRLIEIST
jgi:hypothetical protein